MATKAVSSRQVMFAAILLTALSLMLHGVFLLHAGCLWRDEANTVAVATLPSLGQVWDSLKFESFALLPFCAMRCWAGCVGGHNDFGLRVFGFLIGTGILGALWFNARLMQRTPPVWALVLIGFNIVIIRFGDSLRGYGLGMMFLLITFGLVWRVVERPTVRRVTAAGLAGILSVQSLYGNAFLLAAICIAGAFVCLSNRQWKRAIVVICLGLPAACSLLPYLPVIQQAALVNRPIKKIFALSDLWPNFSFTVSSPNPIMAWVWLGAGSLAVALGIFLGFLVNNLTSEQIMRVRYALVSLLAGTAAYIAYSFFAGIRSSPWYYLSLITLWAICFEIIFSAMIIFISSASGLAEVRNLFDRWSLKRWPMVHYSSVLALLGIALTTTAWKHVLPTQGNMRWLAAQLTVLADKDDFIVLEPWHYGISFNRYYHGSTPWQTLPPLSDHSIHRYDLFWQTMTGQPEASLRQITDQAAKALRANHRVWVLGDLSRLPLEAKLPELKSAPTDAAAWNNGADITAFFMRIWSFHLSRFLDLHTKTVVQLQLPPEESQIYIEDATLLRFEGWHD